MISARNLILLLVIFTVIGILSGCDTLRPPPCNCRIPEPPAELLRVPAPLPPLPIDLPSKPKT